MDVQSIFNAGGTVVKNPNYTKTNGQPEYITVADLKNPVQPEGSKTADIIYQAAAQGNQDIIGRDGELDKYIERGITPTDKNLPNLDKMLADSQNAASKWFNGLSQAVVSEVGLGTLKGFTDLFDFVTSKILHLTEDDYQNPASDAIQEWQDAFNNNIAPIYRDENLNIQNGGLKDAGWWASNLPSVASTLTLLLPAKGISNAGKWIGKVTNVGKGISKARRWATGVTEIEDASRLNRLQIALNNPLNIVKANAATETIAEGLLMRTMENYQEARDTHIQMYQEASDKLNSMSDDDYNAWVKKNQAMFDKDLDMNNRDKVAKAIAKKAADRTFSMDFSNVIFDIIQLHGLKNIGKGVKAASGRIVNEAQKTSLTAAEQFAKGGTEAAKKAVTEATKKPLYKRFGQGVLDYGKYNTKTVFEEATEGIEEAVNFIAQQEGLTYGKAILEGDAKDYRATTGIDSYLTLGIPNIISTWTNRLGELHEYMATPELQESAFWGVMGGVLFHNAGSALNKGKLALYRKAQEKARATNSTTGESVSDSEGWFNLFELPEDKAARVAIEKRIARLEKVSNDLKLIENKFDIFGGRDENNEFKQFTGDVETKQALARRRVEAQFVSDIAMDAMNSGTYKQLIDYFKSDEVKQAMVAAKLATKENIDSYTEQTVKDLEEIKDLYARQSTHVLNQVAALNSSKKYNQTIPLEYAQIIAKRNVDRLLNIRQLDREITDIESLAAEQEAITRETNPDVLFDETKNTTQLAALVDMYSRLIYENKEIDKAIKEQGRNYKLDRQKEKNTRQRDLILNRIKQTTLAGNNAGLSAVFTAVKYSRSYRKSDDGKYEQDKDAFEEADDIILKEAKSLYDEESNLSDETVIQSANVMLNNIKNILGKKGLANVNNKLLSHYVTIGQLKLQKDIERSQISSTQTQIQDDIDWEHNNLNEARIKMIDLATKTIIKAVQQYDGVVNDNSEDLINIIYKMYSQDKKEARRIAEQFMSDSNANGKVTASEFLDALDIFNFSNRTNQGLYEYVTDIINTYKNNRNQERAEDTLEDKTSSTENQEQPTDNETEEEGYSPSPESKLDTEQVNGQNLNKPIPQTQQQNPNQGKRHKIKFIINNSGNIVAIKKANTPKQVNAEVIDNGDGTFTIDISSRPKNEQLRYVIGGLFEGDIDLLDVEAEWEISKNPIVKPKGNGYVLVEKGEIKATKYNVIDEEEYQAFKQLVDGDSNFKNKLLTNPNSVRSVVLEVLDTDDEDKANSYIERYLGENKVDSSSPVEEIDNTLTSTEDTEKDNQKSKETPTEETPTEDTTQTTKTPTEATSNQTPQDSSTGEQDSNLGVNPKESPATSDKTEHIDVIPDKSSSNTTKNPSNKTNEELDNIRRGIAQTFGKYIPDMRAKDIDFDEIGNKVEEELISIKDKVGLSEEEIKTEVANHKQILQKAHEQLMSLQSKLAQNGANLAFASKLEEVDTTDFSLMFTNAMEAFMEEYKKIVVTPTVDSKQLVRLEDVLRICNNVYPTSDNSIAKSMYKVIYNYLNSPIGKAKYLTIDLDAGNKILEDITKTTEQIQKENDEIFDNFRVNIGSFIESALVSNETIRDNYFKVLDSLNTGDELEILATENELIVRYGNTTIGNMPKPKINGDTFVQINEGWITDVKLDSNGDVISSLKPIFEDILLSNTKVHQALRELLIKNALLDKASPTYKSDFDKLVKAFSDNVIIKELVEQARKDKADGGKNKIFINNDSGIVEYNNLLNHLTKLWNYTQIGNKSNSIQEKENDIRISLNRWFNMLYDTYNTVYNINKDLKVKITKINEGQINRAVNDDKTNDINTITHYNELPLINDAVSKGLNFKLSIVSERGDEIDISESNKQNISGWTHASTLISVFSRNEFPDYVKAIGVKLSDNEALKSNTILRNLALASTTHLEEVIQKFINDKGFGNVDEIEDVIRSIIAIENDNDRIPLFRPIKGKFTIENIHAPNSPARGITIVYNDKMGHYRRFRIYTNSKYNVPFGYGDSNSSKETYLGKNNASIIARETAYAFMNFIKDVGNINISRKGIQNDNTKSDITKGFIIRKDGKLQVNIPNKTKDSFNQDFDSYNDFIVKGNLIRVNTKIGENGSNFTRRGTKQTANQILYVSLPKAKKDTKNKSTSESTGNKDIQSTSDATVFNKVRQTIETDKTSVGISIFRDILGDEAYNKFKEITDEFNVLDDILPIRIMFDSRMRDKQIGDKTSPIIVTRGGKAIANYHIIKNGKRVTARIPTSESIVVGNYFLNMASSNNLEKRKEAIRKLIHEQLHINFQTKGYDGFNTIVEINNVYEEFVKHLKEDLDNLDKNSTEYKLLKSIDFSNTGYKGSRLIEEFIVESLTNQTLFKYLNSIQVENGKDNKKEDTLFTKIAKIIAKFFGWNIQDGSLYMKELNVLRDITGREEGASLDEYNSIEEITDTDIETSEETKPDKNETSEDKSENESESKKESEESESKESESEEEPDTSYGFNEDSIDDDLDLDDNDNDDDAYAASIEEVNTDNEGFKPIMNLEVFRNRLPNHLHAKFDRLKDEGWFEIKCK